MSTFSTNVLSTMGHRGHSRAPRWLRRLLVNEAARADDSIPPFFRENIIFHTHVEKSAGATLVQSFKLLFGTNRIYDTRSPRLKRPHQLTSREKATIFVLTGHFHYGRMDRFFARDPVYVACVRHPVNRFFSYYNYVASRPEHPGYNAMAGKSFDDVVAEYVKTEHHSITNPMSRMLTGQRAPSADAVIEHVKKNYLIVAPQQRVDELVRALFHVFDQEGPTLVGRRNVGRYNDEPSSDAAETILRTNQVDLCLYEYVCREFDSMREEMVSRLTAHQIYDE